MKSIEEMHEKLKELTKGRLVTNEDYFEMIDFLNLIGNHIINRNYGLALDKLNRKKQVLEGKIKGLVLEKGFYKDDLVKIVNIDGEALEEDKELTVFIGATGKITDVHKDGEKYPYLVEFDDEDLEKLSTSYGTLLWTFENLEYV